MRIKTSMSIEKLNVLRHCEGKTGHCIGHAQYEERKIPRFMNKLVKNEFIKFWGISKDKHCYSLTKYGKAYLLLIENKK